mgnify:CR=1 FL=1|jgi:hypothetical protein
MIQFSPINITWNRYNGFLLEILYIDTWTRESSLFGINFAKEFFLLNLFWRNIVIYESKIFKDV